MKAIRYVIMIAALTLTSCSRDLTHRPGTRTDYIAGQIYELDKHAFLFKHNRDNPKEIPRVEKLGSSGTPRDLHTFKQDAVLNPQFVGLLSPGDRLQITKFKEHRSVIVGNFLHVYAVIVSGENKGTIVELSMISKEGLPSYSVFVDPEYLTPAK